MLYVNPLEITQTARTGLALDQVARREQATEEFERFFLYTLLKEIRKSSDERALFGGGPAAELYHDMMNDHLAGIMAKSGQIGLAEQIRAQIEEQENPPVRPLDNYPGGLPLQPDHRPAGIPLRSRNAGIPLDGPRSSIRPGVPINHAGTAPRAGDAT